jgi:hypothetical protein
MAEPIRRRDTLKLLAAGAAGAAAVKGLDWAGVLPALAGAPAVVDASKSSELRVNLGEYVFLAPTKMGGGAHATDLASGRTLAWIAYWNYGDTCPISHHLSAYPSADPSKGFEFVNSTQGGDNALIYGIPTRIKQLGLLDRTGEGDRIYRVRFDGRKMEVVEVVSESTGVGLGVHVCVYPDAEGFASADGQKDYCAFFDRARGGAKTKVQALFKWDWEPKVKRLARAWIDGGTLTIRKLRQPPELGKFEIEGTKGNKIDWEMTPMAELLVERGQIPGASPMTLCGADGVVHHPGNRYSAVVVRLAGAGVIIDRQTFEPVACLHTPEGGPGNLPVKKVDDDAWQIEFEGVKCPSHEAGFSPDGRWFTMMNNLRQNNIAVFDTSAADPAKWTKHTFVKDPAWVGESPSPFHMVYSMDGSKLFASTWVPSPEHGTVVVVDTTTWKIVKKYLNVGPDVQTLAVTYDGKYLLAIFSGFQRLASGVFVIDAKTLEPVGYLPSPGGHHDCVIVPQKVEHLRNTRCTTL